MSHKNSFLMSFIACLSTNACLLSLSLECSNQFHWKTEIKHSINFNPKLLYNQYKSCNELFLFSATHNIRVSVKGIKSLGCHFACWCREFDFYEVKKNIIIFQKEKGNTFTLLIIFIVSSKRDKEHKSTKGSCIYRG